MRKQTGIALLEVTLTLALVGMIGCSACIGAELAEKVRFESAVSEVVQSIEYSKQAAVLTGKLYTVLSYKDYVYFIKNNKVYRKIPLGKTMAINGESTGKWLKFNGSIAPKKAGTIIIEDKHLKQRVRITVGVGTGMIRVYQESL